MIVLLERRDMPTIMKRRERVEVVKYCKFVDEVLADTPDITDADYMALHKVCANVPHSSPPRR